MGEGRVQISKPKWAGKRLSIATLGLKSIYFPCLSLESIHKLTSPIASMYSSLKKVRNSAG